MFMFFRKLPPFKGKRRLGNILYADLIKQGKDIPVTGKLGCKYILPNLRETLALDILMGGIYEPETHQFLTQAIPANAIVLDIGANIGSISIPLAMSRKDLKFICLEASPFVFKYLQQNIKLNNLESRFTCINKAVGATDNELLPFYSSPEHFGKGSLSAVFTSDPVMVTSISVDTLLQQLKIDRVGFIKADIEGFEYFLFKGAKRLLQLHESPVILFEFVDWAEKNAKLKPGHAQELLLEYGYHLFNLLKQNRMQKLEKILDRGSAMLVAKKY
jgi:FkbM family methyltransferase